MARKVVIVGGVAGGMSCAGRLKRIDDSQVVTVFEKGRDVSFANCGMPYYIGGVIKDRDSLLVATAESLFKRYGIITKLRHIVTGIDCTRKIVKVTDLEKGSTFEEPYDTLVLSTGATPFRPDIPGADGPGVFVLNDMEDMDKIMSAVEKAKSAVIIGAGFIGLELAENLHARNLKIDIIDMSDHVLPPIDPEMTSPVVDELKKNGVNLHLGEQVEVFDDRGVTLKSGTRLDCDFKCICIGVRPTNILAKDAGLELGKRGHIVVDKTMKTSDANIYAVGDVVEVEDMVTGDKTAVPLAGPASRQGRIVADNICGRPSEYRGTQGTAIVKVFNIAVATTGLNEKRLRAADITYESLHIHPMQHPAYYPGAEPLSIKVLFTLDGKILGAQVTGTDGVDGIINIIATAMQAGRTIEDLGHLELAYSPQWGSAKHPVNIIGFVGSNILNKDVQAIGPAELNDEMFLLDVRNISETDAGTIPGATIIPLGELRARTGELPRDREINIYCAVGLRGYLAYRYLSQQGFKVTNLTGGYKSWCMGNPNN